MKGKPGANLEARMEMIRQMFSTYDKELTPDALSGYLSVTRSVPLKAFGICIRSAMANSRGGFPPGPGDIMAAWHWEREHGEAARELPQENRDRIGAGRVPDQIEASLKTIRTTAEMARVLHRARQIRAEARLVPKGWHEAYRPSLICAALELGFAWPLDGTSRARICDVMKKHEAEGGEADWWWSELKEPTLTSAIPHAKTVRDPRLT